MSAQRAEKIRQKILADDEVRFLAKRLRQVMGEPINGLTRQYGISVEDYFRFSPVAVRLEAVRTRRGLTLKNVAAALKVPQYRLADIEGGRTTSLLPELLIRYVKYLGLSTWFGRWKLSNVVLAKRLRLFETGNLTARSRPTRKSGARPQRGRYAAAGIT